MVEHATQMFDFEAVQPDLVGGNVEHRQTSISLIALADGAFVVVTGIDHPDRTFSDDDIREIFAIFDSTVDANAGRSRGDVRAAIIAAIGDRWKLCETPPPSKPTSSPFDLCIRDATRIVFHLHIENWAFEDACLKFKAEDTQGQFSDLTWLTLGGESQKPMSFSLVDRDSKKGEFPFALYACVRQDGYVTRVIIDPEVGNEGVGGGEGQGGN